MRHAFIGEDGRRWKSHLGMLLLLFLHRGVPKPLVVGGSPHRFAAAMSDGELCKCAMTFVGNVFAGNALSNTIDFDEFKEFERLYDLVMCFASYKLEDALTLPSALSRGLCGQNFGCVIGDEDLCGDLGCFREGE